MVKNLSTEKTQFLHLAAKYKKSNLKRISNRKTELIAQDVVMTVLLLVTSFHI